MDTDLFRDILASMHSISHDITEILYLRYFDKLGNENKYILSVMLDAYKSVKVFCLAMQEIALVQAGALLRQLTEQVAISSILVERPELRPAYIDHHKFRTAIMDLEKEEQKRRISENYGSYKREAFPYLDYGWIEKGYNERKMLMFAGFNDIVRWKEAYLDKMVHCTITSTSLVGPNQDYPIAEAFIQIASKLFDHLCVAFHNLTNFAFVFDGEDRFNGVFRELYKRLFSKSAPKA